MDINDFRKEMLPYKNSPLKEKIDIPKANTLKEQIENYIIKIFNLYILDNFYDIEHIECNGILKETHIKIPYDIEKFGLILGHIKEEIKNQTKTITFNTKKEVKKYIKEKIDDFNLLFDKNKNNKINTIIFLILKINLYFLNPLQ